MDNFKCGDCKYFSREEQPLQKWKLSKLSGYCLDHKYIDGQGEWYGVVTSKATPYMCSMEK